jgi:hypothetical protein
LLFRFEVVTKTAFLTSFGDELVTSFLSLFRVVLHPGNIDEYHWFISHYPCIMARRKQPKFAGAELALCAVIHDDVQSAQNVQIQVWRLAAPRLGNRHSATSWAAVWLPRPLSPGPLWALVPVWAA